MKTSDLAKLALALLVGAAIAFPAGMMVAGSRNGSGRAPTAPAQEAGAVRDMFSPSISGDPTFVARQREGVEALERYCARTGESCAEARAARRMLAELEAAN